MTDRVPTGCPPVDALLDGGLDRGSITQVYGSPASGKTNLTISAAVEVTAGGGTAIYIDTEGMSIDRFNQLAASRGDPDELSDRLVISEVHGFDEQAEAVRDAAELAPRSDLIVLDSATGFYRLERTANEGGESLRALARQLTALLSLARRHDLAVLITNQVYTDPEEDRVRPLGGHTLAHWTGTVIRLDRFRGGNRRATLEKHRSRPTGGSTRFLITENGLESVDSPQ